MWELRAKFGVGLHEASRLYCRCAPWECKLQHRVCSERDYPSSGLFASIPNSQKSHPLSPWLSCASSQRSRSSRLAKPSLPPTRTCPRSRSPKTTSPSRVLESRAPRRRRGPRRRVGPRAGPGTGSGNGAAAAWLVELNCETDFVTCNALLAHLVADVAYSQARLSPDL